MNKALLVLLFCGACPAIPPVPGHGGPAWTELTSDHFIVWTDSSPEAGREAVRKLEHLRQVMFGVSIFNPTSNAKALVFALHSQREVDAYIPGGADAIAVPPRYPLYLPVIVLSMNGLGHDQTTGALTHELAHVISFNALWPQPLWFAEGLAVYFETARLDDDGTFDLGEPDERRFQRLRQTGFTPAADLLACHGDRGCNDLQFYASAWALFSYLTTDRSADLLRYALRLTELTQIPRVMSFEALRHSGRFEMQDEARAWSDVFPDLTPPNLDNALIRWFRLRKPRVHRYQVKFKEFSITQRTLNDADVYTAQALLHHDLDPATPVPAEVKAALAIDPNNVIAQMIRLIHDSESAADSARSLTAVHPDDWRAWWLVTLTAEHREQADAAHARVCLLVAKDPAVLPKGTCPFTAPDAHHRELP